MPFDWEQFLLLADKLVTPGAEAENRSAISRAYYFVYNISKDRAELNGIAFSTEAGFHKQCWASYKRGPLPDAIRIGLEGERMRELRVRADYKKGDFRRLDEVAVQVVADAKKFKHALSILDRKYPLRSN